MGNPEGTFDTSLHEAVRFGDLEEVKVALSHGYDPNLIGLYQWSALHEATHNGETEILRLLLEKKGDPNKSDYLQQRTAMHYASEGGHIECLKLLIDAGGRYDIQDVNGKNSWDLATPGGRRILDKLRVRDLMKMSPEEAQQCVSQGSSPGPVDNISIGSDTLTDSRRSSVNSVSDKGPALGYLHMTVEYHAAKSSLKIRVWQISDLLLPPANTSMIHKIYVKSYLTPDKKKETKRKTEEVKVETSESHVHHKKQKSTSVQHVFTPVSFKFSRALEYSGISNETVKSKQLQIEVCITQKYSYRSFLIGMVNMPLKSAVKKIVKDKVALIPCMNHTIPANMKVYSAMELNIMNNASSKVFFSNPNIRSMLPDDIDASSDKAASNPDLQNKYSPSTEVDMNYESRTAPMVPKLDLSSGPLDESGYSSEFHFSFPGEMESPDSDGQAPSIVPVPHVSVVPMEDKAKGRVRKALENVKGKMSPRFSSVTKLSNSDSDDEIKEIVSSNGGENKEKVRQDIEDWKYQEIKKSVNKSEDQESRPETPTWDYYDMPEEVVTDEPTARESPWKQGAAPVVLPMETTMEVKPEKGQGHVYAGKKDSMKKKAKKKDNQAIPGRAIPIVPKIIVVKADDDKIKKEEAVTMPEDVLEIRVDSGVDSGKPRHDLERKMNVTAMKREMKVEHQHIETETIVRQPILKASKPKHRRNLNLKQRLDKLDNEATIDTGKKTSSKKFQSEVLPSKGNLRDIVKDRTRVSKEMRDQALSQVEVKSVERDSSVVLDMEKLGLTPAGSHVVELEDDISITELSEESQLFSKLSMEPLSHVSDVESGLGDYKLPVNVSPHRYMIPMQVYFDDDTSCDESLSSDYVPTTEL